ncbi:MAG: hypothetical protein ISEC1_P2054 [Thiomicrorhabdus sp.]|nr:MAG: hypothetical protein ISEC1_P2054 [Thiomicrorhabdus sp.]
MFHLFLTLKKYKWTSIVLALLVAALIAIPIIIQSSLQNFLLKQGAAQGIDRVEIADIDFNPFLANIRLEQLTLYRQNKHYAQVDYVEVQISLFALLRKQLLIETLYLSHSDLPIQLADKQIIIAGLALPLERETTDETESSLSFGIGVEEVKLEAVSIRLEHIEDQQLKGKTDYKIRFLTINQETDFHRLLLQSQLNQSDLDANLQLHLFDEEPKVVGTFDLDHFDLAQLRYLADHFAPEVSHYLNGTLSNNLTFTLSQTASGIAYYQQGLIQIEQFVLKQEKLNAAFKQFNWKGDFHFVQDRTTQSNQQAIHLYGQSKLTGLKITENTQNIQLSQDIASQLDLNLQISPENIQLTQTGQLTVNNLKASQSPYSAQVKQLDWQGKLNLNLPNTEATAEKMQLVVSGLINLKALKTNNTKTHLNLATLKALKIGQFSVNNLDTIQLDDIQLTQLSLLRAKNTPPLLNLHKLNLDHSQLAAIGSNSLNQLTLGALSLQGSQTHLIFNKDGKIALIKQLQQSLPATQSMATKTSSGATNDQAKISPSTFNYRLKRLTVSGDNQVLIKSDSGGLPLNKMFNLTKLTLGTIDSQKPKANTPYEVNIVFDEFSKIVSKGQFQALNPKLNLQAKTNIESLSLLALSPFAEQFIGYQVKSGQLTASLETQIKDNKLNALNDLYINQLEVSGTDNKGQAFKKQLSIPLEAGISLLKDRKDNIHLKLPIKGDLSDLNFDLNDIITTAVNNALLKATKSYLLLALQPFGAILMAGEFVADQLTSVKLQMITFEPGDSNLNPEMQSYLGKISQLLEERKGIQIKLCGGTKESDRPALKEIAKLAADKAVQAAEKTDSDSNTTAARQAQQAAEESVIDDEQLFSLAQERKKVIKRKLVELGSSANQIILCQPTIEATEGKPSVEVGI